MLERFLNTIIKSPWHHARWLNTLSYMENTGARYIAACEHPTLVKKEMLKHAAEEFRHAHFLKTQIEKVSDLPLVDYSLNNLLGGLASLHYLQWLNLKTCRYLIQEIKVCPRAMPAKAYLLVTYAIECRAEWLYTVYDAVLRQTGSSVRVKSIFLEELEHLDEMRIGIQHMPDGEDHAKRVSTIEADLFKKWMLALQENRADDTAQDLVVGNR